MPPRTHCNRHISKAQQEGVQATFPITEDGGCLGAAEAAVWQVIMCFINSACHQLHLMAVKSGVATERSALRASLAQQHLQTLKHILGVRSTVNTQSYGRKCQSNALKWSKNGQATTSLLQPPVGTYIDASLPVCSVTECAHPILQAVGYTFQVRADDLDPKCTFDIKLQGTMQSGKISHSALGHAPLRVPASVHMMHHWFARPSHIHPKTIFRLPVGACSGSGWAATSSMGSCVGKVSLGSALCVRVNSHVVFECPGLQAIRM